MEFFDYTIKEVLPSRLQGGKTIIHTLNPHSFCIAKTDRLFKESLLSADYLIPDGVGIVLAVRILFGKKIKKVSGSDLHAHVLQVANDNSLRVFYLGASESTLLKIKEKVNLEHPNIEVGCYSPPYKNEFDPEDNRLMREKINGFKTDVLFVGMTAPKQEKWIYENIQSLNVLFASGIGAVFDFYAGTVKRPSQFWIKMGLEWLPRLFREPKRLWKRNFHSTPEFLFDIIKEKITPTSRSN
ncbi:WecB/TagA/CpsF family glycosyltransferase [Cyclobacterium xiamenense]|uniref:WecB/TagA/CpsF family glycosyltransferase n=1 Tax=Cyclobacterium xiamenense TaxID=1297121 RepID=UPI0012B90373|nr:WecB/TagA/CpsF family glycosyltransferase [Cyclobacterium xiamenense]